MKPLLTALLVSLAAAPALAQSIDVGSMIPVLTWPEPAPEPVTQDAGGIDQ